jgi:hypothetical protein
MSKIISPFEDFIRWVNQNDVELESSGKNNNKQLERNKQITIENTEFLSIIFDHAMTIEEIPDTIECFVNLKELYVYTYNSRRWDLPLFVSKSKFDIFLFDTGNGESWELAPDKKTWYQVHFCRF